MRLFARLSDAVLNRLVPSAKAGACTWVIDECKPNGVLGIRCCHLFLDCPPGCWYEPYSE